MGTHHVTIGTGGSGTRFIRHKITYEEGLDSTDDHEGRISNLIPDETKVIEDRSLL